jgi:hypothetical protein
MISNTGSIRLVYSTEHIRVKAYKGRGQATLPGVKQANTSNAVVGVIDVTPTIPQIAEFLGQTVSVAQRWQKSGMPVTREGRSVFASPEELTAWVGTERGQKGPIHIASEAEDLLGDLKQGLAYVRKQKKVRRS